VTLPHPQRDLTLAPDHAQLEQNGNIGVSGEAGPPERLNPAWSPPNPGHREYRGEIGPSVCERQLCQDRLMETP
jgi:hypothetical protein